MSVRSLMGELQSCSSGIHDYPASIGLDIVPLHPDLQQVGNVDYASRITWVQANLYGWTFDVFPIGSNNLFAAWKAFRSPMMSLTSCKLDVSLIRGCS